MNTLFIVVIGAVVIYLAYNFYARRIDRNVIQANASRATPINRVFICVPHQPE